MHDSDPRKAPRAAPQREPRRIFPGGRPGIVTAVLLALQVALTGINALVIWGWIGQR